MIRVALVCQPRGWVAFFRTDPDATAAGVLAAVADRFAPEPCLRDLKEVWGAGPQQVRDLWACLGAFHLNLWLHALTELWAWGRPARRPADRRQSPWGKPGRRPSHAGRRKALRRACLQEDYQAATSGSGQARKVRRLARRLLRMVA